ncbi:MAG: CARDB domain-containing protein [archaeon]
MRHITLDVSPPVIIIVYPDNGTSHYSSLIDFNVSVGDALFSVESCLASLDGAENLTMTMFNSSWFNYSYSGITHGVHNLTVSCNDSLGNWNSATENNFDVTLTDLTIDYVSLPNIIYSNSTFIEINISNPSPPNAINVNVSCYLDDVVFESKSIAQVDGAGWYLTNCTLTTTSGWNKKLNVTVDPANVIPESDETNNENVTYINVTELGGIDAWDSEDDSENKAGWLSEDEPLPTELTYFFANYTMDNSSASVAGATCNVTFSDGGESGTYDMDYNATAELYYSNRTFDYAGNYSWNTNCSKIGYELQTDSGVVNIRIPLTSNSSVGFTTEKIYVNYNENVNVSVDVTGNQINKTIAGYNVSAVWVNILRPNTTSLNLSLSAEDGDGADGGIWNNSFNHSMALGDYAVTYFANLTNGFGVVKSVTSNFSVQNTSIGIAVGSEANTTQTLLVEGQINRTNGTAHWSVPNNLFVIKLNNVTVSSNTLNHTNFTGATGVNMNLSSVAQLNLTSESSVTSYSDSYTTTGYTLDSYNYSNVGFYAGDGVLFELYNMIQQTGNITYKFTSATKFYNASAYVDTFSSPSDGGGNTSVWYSFDDSSYALLQSTTSSGVTIGGTIPADGYKNFYVKVISDVSSGFDKENPVTAIEINYSSYDYASVGNLTSPAINLADVTYTVLRWSENLPTGTDVKIQLTESDDGLSWDAWGTNYTSGLNNDITALSKDYVQYRAWLTTTNGSVTPSLSDVRILYFNATTNSSGGFAYNITIPTNSLGVVPLEITVNENSLTGIVGTKSQDLEVWAQTSLPYSTNANYSGVQTNYSVTFNWTRVDNGDLINGTFNISLGNLSGGVLDSQQCSGVSQCTASWLVPGDFGYGNYTINVSAHNESEYYRNVSAGYIDWLEQKSTTGSLYVENETISDYNPATTYELYVNATLTNNGNASMLGVNVFDNAFLRSNNISSITEVTPCTRIYPGESCNASMLVVIKAGIGASVNAIKWRANWTNNDGTIAEGSDYINYNDMAVEITLNATMTINESAKSLTVQHDRSGIFYFNVDSTGTDIVTNINSSLIEGNLSVGHLNLSSDWVVFSPNPIATLNGGTGQSVKVNVSVPAQTSSGNYSGRINVNSSNGGSGSINLTVEVPVNSSWHYSPMVNLTNNNTFALNTAGEIGNITIYNTGNINLSFDVDYANSRTTDYRDPNIFTENNNVSGLVRNPTQLNVTKGGSAVISMYQEGSAAPWPDIGVDVVWNDSDATPTSGSYQDAWWIVEQAPNVTGVWFLLDGVNSSISEANKNLTIMISTTDDVAINESATTVNVTNGVTTTYLNATHLSGSGTADNFSVNFTPTGAGVHNVVVSIYDNGGKNHVASGYSFMNYLVTTGALSLNDSAVTLSKIDRTHGENVSINFTLNNTGMVYMYSPTIGFTLPGNVSATNASLGNLSAGVAGSAVVSFNVSAMSAPGNYVVPVTARWRNPDNSYSTDTDSLTISVLSNSSFSYSPSSLSLTIPSGATNSSLMTVNNTGNAPLTSVNFTCQSGTVCSAFTVGYNASAFSVPINSSSDVNVSVTAAPSYAGGNYNGVINISAVGVSNTFYIYVTVPETWTWDVTPTAINGTKVAGTSDTLQAVVINNTGNMNINFGLNSTNATIIQPNVSSILVSAGTTGTFMINYTAPEVEGSYYVNITIGNSSANPTTDVVQINLTATDVVANITSPTNVSPITNVTAGDNLTMAANATYGGIVINESLTWSATINGTDCVNASYFFDSNNTYWNISCLAPSLTDGVTYDLTLTLVHPSYGSVSKISNDSIVYRDLTAPKFVVTRNHVELGGNINLSVNVSDAVGVDSVWGVLTYPNETTLNLTLSSSGGLYVNDSFVLDLAGEYAINYSANDSTGNENSTSDWFEVRDRYYWYLTLTDYAGTAVPNVNVSLYRPDTTTLLVSNVTNASGVAQLYINKRFYDFDFKIANDSLRIKNVNFTNWTTSNISFNGYGIDGEDVDDVITLYEPFIGIAVNSSGLSSNAVSAVFNYSGYGYDSPLALGVVRCSVWNYTDRSCSGSWSALTSSRDIDLKTITGNASGLSAYFLAENKCGNGACEAIYGETTTTCSADCVATTTTTTTTTTYSSGGGGGGGGLSSGDLAEIERIVKSFLDIGGIKLETTSIYKELFPGDTATVRIKLRNTVNSDTPISLKVTGDIIPLVFFESTNIVLKASERRDVSIKIIIPKFARIGDYDGDLVVTSGEEEGVIPFTIKVLPPEGKLLDVKVQPLTPTVAPGEILRLQVDLLNLGKTKSVDVQFDLQLIDVNTGEIVTRQEEAFAVETSLSTIKNLTVPEYVEPGRYMVKGVAYYSNAELEGTMQASSIAYVQVQYHFFKRKLLGIYVWLWWLALMLIGVIVGGYYLWNYLEYRKKRFKVQLDVSKLPQATTHSEFVGKIAETGIRTFVDLDKLQMHTLIAGATGGGKTVAAQDIVESALLHKKSVIVFDPTAQWTGFLRGCEDAGMLKRYKYFDMKTGQARAFDGSIKTIHDPYEMIDIAKYMDRPGEISIFNVSNLSPKEIDVVVASTIEQIFKLKLEESKELKTLIVYDEVHRLLPKFGGSGQGFIQLERGAREFRKWGVGLVLISQVLSDFVGEIKANIGTEIQMGTRYEGDLERVSMKYGDDVLKSVVKEPIGTGMNVNAEYNNGRPYFVSYRPLLHSTRRLSNDELAKYEKYFMEIEDLDYQAEQLKKLGIDTLDVELEIKLSKAKVKSGQFQMADMYLETLKPKLIGYWKKIGKEPMHIVRKKIASAEIAKAVQIAKIERAKYLKKNPEKRISFKEEVSKLKERMEALKKGGKDTSNVAIRVKGLEERLKPFKGVIPSEDSQSIAIEINELKRALVLREGGGGVLSESGRDKKVVKKK